MNAVDFEEFVSVFRTRTAARLTEFERVLDDVAKDIEQRAGATSSRGKGAGQVLADSSAPNPKGGSGRSGRKSSVHHGHDSGVTRGQIQGVLTEG